MSFLILRSLANNSYVCFICCRQIRSLFSCLFHVYVATSDHESTQFGPVSAASLSGMSLPLATGFSQHHLSQREQEEAVRGEERVKSERDGEKESRDDEERCDGKAGMVAPKTENELLKKAVTTSPHMSTTEGVYIYSYMYNVCESMYTSMYMYNIYIYTHNRHL